VFVLFNFKLRLQVGLSYLFRVVLILKTVLIDNFLSTTAPPEKIVHPLDMILILFLLKTCVLGSVVIIFQDFNIFR